MSEPMEAEVRAVGVDLALGVQMVQALLGERHRNRLFRDQDGVLLTVRTHRSPAQRGEVMALFTTDRCVLLSRGATWALTDVSTLLGAGGHQPPDVLLALVEVVSSDVDDVLGDLDEDVLQIEEMLFSGGREDHTHAIHRVKRELLELRRSVMPLGADLGRLLDEGTVPVPPRLDHHFTSLLHRVTRSAEGVEHLDALTSSVLSAQLAQIAVRQNQDQRRISAWAAIALVPTGVGAVYGMNFEHMPELGWALGYPAVVVLMLVLCACLFTGFRRHGWL